jgi:hypothetical protein
MILIKRTGGWHSILQQKEEQSNYNVQQNQMKFCPNNKGDLIMFLGRRGGAFEARLNLMNQGRAVR